MSVTRRLAVLLPVVVGLNCTPISQPPSGATVTPVHPVFGPSWKCDAPVPVIVGFGLVAVPGASFSGPLPLLPMTALSCTEVDPTPTVPKARPAGGTGSDTYITGRFEPVSATFRVAAAVSSVIVSVAAEASPNSGVKVTLIAQRAPPASVAGATGQS